MDTVTFWGSPLATAFEIPSCWAVPLVFLEEDTSFVTDEDDDVMVAVVDAAVGFDDFGFCVDAFPPFFTLSVKKKNI